MEGERVADRQHLPGRALTVELEVAVTGVIGQLARRHRQRQQRDTGQLQADEFADLVARRHLGLLQQLFAQLLLRHAGTHCQHEVGALHQLALVDHGHHDAVLVLAQLDGDGTWRQHGTERLTQGQHHRLEAHLLIVMTIGGELGGRRDSSVKVINSPQSCTSASCNRSGCRVPRRARWESWG